METIVADGQKNTQKTAFVTFQDIIDERPIRQKDITGFLQHPKRLVCIFIPRLRAIQNDRFVTPDRILNIDRDEMIPFYFIGNVGTYLKSKSIAYYPYHLMLVQQFTDIKKSDRKRLMVAISRIRANCPDSRIILDNGAYEGIELNVSKYAGVVESLKPDVVVLPDRSDGNKDDLEPFSELLMGILDRNEGYSPEFMYVPQSEKKEDLLYEYSVAIEECSDDIIIGLGMGYYHYCTNTIDRAKEEMRYAFVSDVMNLPGASKRRFHLLGARWFPTPLFSRWDNIVGIDCFKPCRSALELKIYPTVAVNPKDQMSMRAPVDLSLVTSMAQFCDAYNLKRINMSIGEMQ